MRDLLERHPFGEPNRTDGGNGEPTKDPAAQTEPEANRPAFGTEDPDGIQARQAGERARAAVVVVDQTFHAAMLLGRAVFYLLLSSLCERVSIGPHFVAGMLLGDFLAAVAIAAKEWRCAPRATFAELGLFAALFAYWWSGYEWPAHAEFEALLLLTTVGTAAGRFGAHARRSMSVSGWD